MKRVNYQKLIIQNFLSIGKEKVEIEFKKGIHIITGVNKDKTDRKNGVGKSTIADAFYFAHFGETIRNIKKELIVNDITNQTAKVTLFVDVINNGVQDCYQIERTLKPSKLALFKNSVDITLDSISNTTSFITDLLGLTPSIMTNCVVMTLNDTTPFMAKGKPEKRKFIEDVFDLDMFGRMLTLLKRDYSETKKLVEVKKAQVDEIRRAVMNLKEQHEKLVTLRTERVAHYEKRKADNIIERDKLNEEIKSFAPKSTNDLKATRSKYKTAYDRLLNAIQTGQSEISRCIDKGAEHQRNKLKVQKAIDEGFCTECQRYVTDHDHKFQYGDLINELEEKRRLNHEQVIILEATQKENCRKRDALWALIEKMDDTIRDNIQLIEEQKTRTKRLEMIDGWIKELDQDIESAKSSTQSFTKTIVAEAERLRAENALFATLQNKFKVLDSTKFILGDEGVKTHIIKKLIDMLNSRLTGYIRKLDGNCICKFNEYFEEEIINNKSKIRSYFNFSGAEKKAVDLACLFAFSDIKRLQGGVSYNVSIYDELFDTSLDETGVGHVINILNERVESNSECVLIISHRKEAIKAVTGDIIYLEKRNDITRRVDYDPSLS